MKKNVLTMLAAIFICGLTVTTLSACSSDDDDKTEGKTEVTMMYAVKVTDDVLKVADVEVNYIDQTGAKKKEKLGTTEWIADGYGSDPEAKPTTAQTAGEIADWCSQSPTISFAIDQTGYSKQQHVDFGGNRDAVIDMHAVCIWFFGLFGEPPSFCDK